MRNKIVATLILTLFFALSSVAFSPSFASAQTGTSNTTSSSSSGSGWNISSVTKYGLPDKTLTSIITNILLWLLGILGVVGVIGFVVSGLMYLLSAGNDDMMGKAKKGLTYSLIGIIVGLAGVVIIQAISAILNASTTI